MMEYFVFIIIGERKGIFKVMGKNIFQSWL